MPRKTKVVLFNPAEAALGLTFKGKSGKFIGCCPACNLTLGDWEFTDAKKTKVKCSRCETVSPSKKLVAYKSINDDIFGDL